MKKSQRITTTKKQYNPQKHTQKKKKNCTKKIHKI